MTRGKVTIGIVAIGSSLTVFFFGWNSWLSLENINIGKQNAAIVEWQETTDESLKEYQKATDARLEKLTDVTGQMSVDIATIKEFTRLLALKEKIDTSVVERRIIQQNDKGDTELASTTAQK